MEPKEAKEAEADVIYRTLFWRPLSEVWFSAEGSEMKGSTVKGLVGHTGQPSDGLLPVHINHLKGSFNSLLLSQKLYLTQMGSCGDPQVGLRNIRTVLDILV